MRLFNLLFRVYQKTGFILGAGFIYLLLSLSPANAEETAPSPSETQPATNSAQTPSETSTATSTSTEPVLTPSPTPTPEPTPSSEPSPSPSPEASPTSSPEPTPSPTPTQTPQPTQEPSPTTSPTTDTETTPPTEPAPPVVVETVTPGVDDTSYRIPITVPVLFNGVEYTDIYATTNSVITFGQPDNTFHTYPSTPSISIEFTNAEMGVTVIVTSSFSPQ